MKIRCENCHSDFYYDPPMAGDLPLFTTCSHCEYPNPVPGGGSKVEQASVVYTQCFNCGRQMAHNSDLAIPICSNCQEGEEKASSIKEWMVKKGSGQIYGPFDLETLQAWIEGAKIDPKDEVAKVGGQWKRFEKHTLFSRFFNTTTLSGTSISAHLEPMVPATPPLVSEKAAPRKMRINWKQWTENLLALCGIAAAMGGSYWLILREWLVVPEPWIERARSFVNDEVLASLQSDADSSRVSDPGAAELRKLLERLRQAHSDVHEPSSTLFARGRTAFLRDTAASLTQARNQLEMAVLANPGDALALAGLGEVYSSDGSTALQEDAVRLIDEANRLNRSSAEVHRARAAFSLATKQLDQARAEAQECLKLNPRDGEAEYYIGMSYLKPANPRNPDALAHLQKAVTLDPQLHKAYHQLGIVYLNLTEYQKAHQALQHKLSLDPRNARALAEMGRLFEEVGDIGRAIDFYDQAYRANDGEDPRITMDLAVLLYQGRGLLGRARSLLLDLAPPGKPPRLSLPDHKLALTHLAAVQRLNGETGASLETADRALEIDPNYGPALFQKGLAYITIGRLNEAGQALRAASTGEGQPDIQSAIKFYLGRIASAQSRVKDAIDEFEGAAEVFKPNLAARLALVDAHLQLGQTNEGLSAALVAARQDPLYMNQRALRTAYYHVYPDLRSAMPEFNKLAQDRFYVAEATSNLGILQLHLGFRGAAIQTFQHALEVSSDNVTALLSLSILAVNQAENRTAVTLLNRLLELDSQIGLAYVYLGMAYTGLGQYDDADLTFQKALRYARENPTLHDGIGLLKVKRGHPEQAREAFMRALELDSRYTPARRHLFQYVP